MRRCGIKLLKQLSIEANVAEGNSGKLFGEI